MKLTKLERTEQLGNASVNKRASHGGSFEFIIHDRFRKNKMSVAIYLMLDQRLVGHVIQQIPKINYGERNKIKKYV